MTQFRLSKHARRAGTLILATLCSWAGGCRQSPQESYSRQAADLDLRQAFDRLRACRQAGAYTAMRPHIHPSGRDGIIDLLVAVDELMLANAAALEAVKRSSPGIDVAAYDLSFVQDNLELFSRDVQWVDAREQGDRAVVTVQIAHRLPLVRVNFERHGGVWQYLPGPEQPQIVRSIHQLTRALDQVELALAEKRLTRPQIEREYQLRLGYRLRQFGTFCDAAQTREVRAEPAR